MLYKVNGENLAKDPEQLETRDYLCLADILM